MIDDNDRVRRAFAKFLKENRLSGRGISQAAGMSSSAASQFIQGNARSPKADTLRAFARGASELLNKTVTVADLTGERLPKPPPQAAAKRGEAEVPIQHYVGAGDEVHLFDGDGNAIDYAPAPPGFERDKSAAVIVRGDSMRPIFDPGDMLYFRFRFDPPAPGKLPERPVIVQVKDGPLYVKKLLPGTRRGRFHLLSINPLTPPLQDQPVECFAYIEWVKPKVA